MRHYKIVELELPLADHQNLDEWLELLYREVGLREFKIEHNVILCRSGESLEFNPIDKLPWPKDTKIVVEYRKC